MTIGISKEFISTLCASEFETKSELVDYLNEHCKELNPWLPIDENTPRDRFLQLGRLDGFQCVGRYIPQFGHWVDQNQAYVEVTHYQKLPEAPL